jgi:hypothetical protein
VKYRVLNKKWLEIIAKQNRISVKKLKAVLDNIYAFWDSRFKERNRIVIPGVGTVQIRKRKRMCYIFGEKCFPGDFFIKFEPDPDWSGFVRMKNVERRENGEVDEG